MNCKNNLSICQRASAASRWITRLYQRLSDAGLESFDVACMRTEAQKSWRRMCWVGFLNILMYRLWNKATFYISIVQFTKKLPLIQNNKALLAYFILAMFEFAIIFMWVECSSFLLMKVLTYWQMYLKIPFWMFTEILL